MFSRLFISIAITLLLFSFKSATAQYCIDWSSIVFNSASSSKSNTTNAPRGNDWDIRWGINNLIPLGNTTKGFMSYGLKIGIYKMISDNHRWALGVNAGIGSYGSENDALEFDEFSKYTLNQNTYEVNLSLIYRWLNFERFHAYAGVFGGLFGIRTTCQLTYREMGENEHDYWPCDESQTEKIGSLRDFQPNIGVTLGFQYVFNNSFDKFFIEASYQDVGETKYVPRKGAETVANSKGKFPLQMNFDVNISLLQILSPRVGFSHSF